MIRWIFTNGYIMINYMEVIINAAKSHLENEIDTEQKLLLEEALNQYAQEANIIESEVHNAKMKGYNHTFCGMNFSLSDNPYNILMNPAEWQAWRDGYYEGIEAT